MQVSLRKGVSLVEVVVGTIIIAIAFAGLLATFIGVRRYVRRANRRLITISLVSQRMSEFYRHVDRDWSTVGDLRLGTRNIGPYTIDSQLYQDAGAPNSYTVAATGGAFRRVNVTINYPDPD